ncbi:FadR/GntR family transcriptional regulator [Meridianimarinicoccus aquatilis]|uniref:FadR family transcriptional regulator n=1 Tax=Meridianimarinicoccus aquatilis TaxID=2552766 RepID=A0A4R6ATL1_9RHOB|nr:FCD domain-containing protein [Fluviibacterium aquatile]QIE43493.1 FadR family transcriptional regulator [Rhodobacteraceae bacterium SC52]TDL85496.1 FadR family transcriptional regulator [Fluviibacterium aquatile]
MIQHNKAIKADPTVDRLRNFISEGGYSSGDRLPAERELTERLALSRTELRKALDALEREGAVWRHVGKGTFVADRDSESDVSSSILDISRKLTPFRMVRARLVIEPAIAREAAINASAESLRLIERAMVRTRNATTWAEYEQHDDLLHHQIATASDNLLLVSLFEQLNLVRRAVSWGSVVRDSVRPSSDHTSFAEHEAIFAALTARDKDAAYEAMRSHLHSVSGRLFGES